MCATREAWIVAASVGAVHAMKDQGFCRWSYTVRSIHQHAMNNMRSFLLQAQKLSSSSSAVIFDKMNMEKKDQSEESLRKVMYLSCWGPYWHIYILVSPHVFLATNLIWIWLINIAARSGMELDSSIVEFGRWIWRTHWRDYFRFIISN